MKVSDLSPNLLNPRKIDDFHLDALGKSLKKFGDLSGIIFNRRTGRTAGGHQRVKNISPDATVSIITNYLQPTATGTVAEGFIEIDGERFNYREVDWDETTEKAANISANKQGGEFDIPKLNDWLLELDQENYDMDLLGFSPEELENLLIPVDYHGNTDEDDVPGIPKEARTRLGDLYQLGDHRLLCGDATNIQHVEKLMAGNVPNLMITDPPYGVEYDASWRAQAKGVDKTDREETASLENDSRSDWYDAFVLFQGNIAYVWHASSFTDVVMESLRKASFEIKQQIIWNKNVHALSRSNYHWKHEPCWYAVKKGADHSWNGGRDQMTVWDIKNVMFEKDKTSHPTQKPVEIYEIAILNHTGLNEFVYDPFAGSGTQIIACEKTNRKSLSIELDPKFCDVIVDRWEKFSGKKAELING